MIPPRRRPPPLLRRTLVAGAILALAMSLGACAIPRWPVDGPITSPFGLRWRGILPEVHRGVDIRVPEGSPVRVMAPGRVRFAGEMRGFGRVVWVEHGEAVLSVYAHLSEIHVDAGEVLAHRRVLGLSGATGNAEGPVLHFEIWRWGREVDPVPLLGGFPRPQG